MHSVLKDVFGYDRFRPLQQSIIEGLLDKKDALVVMPTGGGKSLCYQLPAIVEPGLTIVISPLIALMTDQVTSLRQLDIEAVALHSQLNQRERQDILEVLRLEKAKLLYLAPETLLLNETLTLLSGLSISLIAVDEAHCISVWGNDFRPEYAALGCLKHHFPNTPIVALTATADKATQSDIVKQLEIGGCNIYVDSFRRKNILIRAKAGLKRKEKILQFIRDHENESGIIYCLSRKGAEKLSKAISEVGYSAGFYHAGMDSDTRRQVQHDFVNDEIHVICATIAFGMGIDKSNVRYVIHYNLPKNLESYYQEIGRAGRDGLSSETLLFYSWNDRKILEEFIEKGEGVQRHKQVQIDKLERMWQFATSTSCRTNFILNYFGEFETQDCGHCDICQNPPKRFDGTVLAQKALSAVARTREQIVATDLIHVLRGSMRKHINQAGWHQLKTFGSGRDLSFQEWREYIAQLLNLGLLTIDYSDYSHVKLTPLSMDVLKGHQEVSLYKHITVESKRKIELSHEKVDQSLLNILKEWRRTQANQRSVPAYVILSDASLNDLCKKLPVSNVDLLDIHGIGQIKAKRYGNTLLKIIEGHRNGA